MKILICNGPNLNLLGEREKEFYGKMSFEEYLKGLKESFPDISIGYFQSNVEGELINKLQQADKEYDAVILNPAAYTHSSVAISDCIRAMHIPVIEVHISNTFAREEYRQQSLTAPYCKGVVIGFGLDSYRLALQAVMDYFC